MAKSTRELSVAELERMLSQRKTEFDDLLRTKTKLQRDLAKVEKRMAALGGRGGKFISSSGRFGKRPKNAKSLYKTVIEILSRSKKGYSLAQIAEKVLATGYKSNSTDFKNVVYQCLYNADEIIHDPETGTYRLK